MHHIIQCDAFVLLHNLWSYTMPNAFLIGKKTILRPVHPTDIPVFTGWINGPITRKYLLKRFPMSELAEKEWLEKTSILPPYPSNIHLVIELKKSGTPIGTMGLFNINWIDRNATTGTTIGEEKYRGKGYASDAKMILLQYAFETLGMHKIISRAFARNDKSIEYSKRCGYTIEATHKEEIFRAGKWEDIVSLACFYESWKKAQAQQQMKK